MVGFRVGWCTFVILYPRLGSVWCITRKENDMFRHVVFLFLLDSNQLTDTCPYKVTGHSLRFIELGAKIQLNYESRLDWNIII